MQSVMSATEARIHFGEVLQRVGRNETITVQHAGKPAAVILSISEYARLRECQSEQEDWRARLRKTRQEMRKQLGGVEISAADLIRQGREERDEQLLDALLGR